MRIGLFIGAGLALLTTAFQLFSPLQGDLISYWLPVMLLAVLYGFLPGVLAALQLRIMRWLLRRRAAIPEDYTAFLALIHLS